MQGETTFRLDRPPEEVFAYLADLERAPEWVPDLVSVTRLSRGPVGVGTRYAEVVRMGGGEGHAEIEVTEYEPGRLFAHSGRAGPSRFSGRFALEPDGDGTRVTHTYSVTMGGLARLAAPLVSSWVRRNVDEAVRNLQQVLEA